MSPETRAALKAACAASAARFRERERLMARIEELRAELIEAQRDIHEAMAKAYGQGYQDGAADWKGYDSCKDYGPCQRRDGALPWRERQ